MKAPDRKWEWTPPSLWFGRSQLYLAMGLLTVIAVLIALKSETYLGSRADDSFEEATGILSEPNAPAAEPVVAQEETSADAAEAQVVAEGYQVAQSWTPLQVPAGDHIAVTLSLEAGSSYVVLTKGALGCDTDLVLNGDIQDVGSGPDARIAFDVSTSGEAVVNIPAASTDVAVCDVSYAVFRR